MDKDLKRHGRLLRDAGNFVGRKFAGENDPFDAEAADKLDAARFGERHLRRAVNR